LAACGGEPITFSERLVAAQDGQPGPVEALSGQQLEEGTELLALENANLRAGPSPSAAVLAVVARGATVKLLEGTPRDGFYKVALGALQGWSYGAHYTESPSIMTREQALTATEILNRAATVENFSYWWGHGRWNPGSTAYGSCSGGCPSCSHSGSYGADCSGFVAKAWQVPSSNVDYTDDAHPYSTYNFDNETTHWDVIPRGSAQPGDAFVYNTDGAGHIFIFKSGDPWGGMNTYECIGCASGCGKNYRSSVSTAYKVIRRRGLISDAPNRLDSFVLGTNGIIYQKAYQTGSGWSSFINMGAPTVGAVGDPSAVSWAENRIDLFTRGGDNAIWHKSWNGSIWSGWASLGGSVTSSPDAASWSSGRLDVFAMGTNGQLYHKYYASGTGWSGWGSVGAPTPGITSNPSAVSWGSGRLDLFVRGGDNAVWHKYYVSGTGWSGWASLGGSVTSSPDAASWSSGRLDLFAVGTNGELYHKSYASGSGWSGWGSVGAPTPGITSDPGAVSWGSGRIDFFVRGGDNALWHKWWSGGWSGWESLGGAVGSGPDAASWSN
jgi:hypothetical protein